MRILYLTTEGFDTPNPCSQLVMVLIRELIKAGHSVHLIQSRRTKEYPDIPDMLNGLNGFECDTIDRKIIGKHNFVKRYFNEVRWAFQSFSRWRKICKKIDVVILQSCPTATYQLLLLRLFCRKPIIYNVYDMWPGNILELGITKSKFLVNIFKIIQRIGYRCCSKIMVMSNDMREMMLNEKVKPQKVTVLQSWYDDENIYYVSNDSNRFIEKFNLKNDKFVVQFAGTIGYSFDYLTFFNVARLLKNRDNIVFHIIGVGGFLDELKSLVEKNDLTNIMFFPIQPIDEVRDVYSECDVELIPLSKGLIGVGVPSKIPLLMACKKVIISAAEDNSDYFRFFAEKGIGVVVPQGDSERLAAEILDLSKNKKRYLELSNKAYDYAINNYSSSVCITVLLQLLKDFEK